MMKYATTPGCLIDSMYNSLPEDAIIGNVLPPLTPKDFGRFVGRR
jgi:hypothetical protein